MSRTKETLVILIPGFPETEADTTCLPFHQFFVRSLKKNYPDLNIIILSFQYPYHTNPYKWYEIETIPFSGKNKGGILKILLRQKILASLKKVQTENKIIGLLSFWCHECALVGKRFADKHQIKHFCWLMGQDAKLENNYPKKTRLSSDELIALSDFLQDEFQKNHAVKPAYIITPGIDSNFLLTTTIEKDVDLLAVGSLIPLKQYVIFIETVAEIKKQIPGVKAVLIGKGVERLRLQELIYKLHLEQNIILTGELPYLEVLQWMQKTRVFLHPSMYEGFGVVCIEALNYGAKVVSFVSPMRNRIENWFVANNKEEMINITLKILKKPKAVYKQVLPFKLDDTVNQIMKLFANKAN